MWFVTAWIKVAKVGNTGNQHQIAPEVHPNRNIKNNQTQLTGTVKHKHEKYFITVKPIIQPAG